MLLLAGCSKGASSSCPSVDDLAQRAGSAAGRRELEIVVKRCIADDWPASVTKCLREAQNDAMIDPCFKALSPDQKARLEKAFAPINDEYAAKDRAEVRQFDVLFGQRLAGLNIDQLPTRAPQCADYLAAIEAVRKATLDCKSDAIALEQYAIQQVIIADVTKLAKTAEVDVGAACTQMAAGLRDEAKHICNH